jgi:hypothetical protein
MYNVLVTIATTTTPIPTAGQVFGHMNLTSTDAAGAVQNLALNGSETPPWSITVNGLADGTSTFVAQSVDATGAALLAAFTGTYSPAGTPSFPLPTGMSFAPA